MIRYAEVYSTGQGRTYGIEDHGDGLPASEHFFHDDYLDGRRKRFVAWRGGCSCGKYDSLIEARESLAMTMLEDLSDEIASLEARLTDLREARSNLVVKGVIGSKV